MPDDLTVAASPPSSELASFPAGTYVTDAGGRIISYNEAAVRLWGQAPELGERWCGYWRIRTLDGCALPHDECLVAVAIEEDRPIRSVESYAERPDGSTMRFCPHPMPIRDRLGHLTGASTC